MRDKKSFHNHVTRDIKPIGECHGCDLSRLMHFDKKSEKLEQDFKIAIEALEGINEYAPAMYEYNDIELGIIQIARKALNKIKNK